MSISDETDSKGQLPSGAAPLTGYRLITGIDINTIIAFSALQPDNSLPSIDLVCQHTILVTFPVVQLESVAFVVYRSYIVSVAVAVND